MITQTILFQLSFNANCKSLCSVRVLMWQPFHRPECTKKVKKRLDFLHLRAAVTPPLHTSFVGEKWRHCVLSSPVKSNFKHPDKLKFKKNNLKTR